MANFDGRNGRPYYLPVVNVLYRRQQSPAVETGRPLPVTMLLPLVILAVAVIFLGLWPELVNWLTEAAVISISGGS
jgi:NADH:ubiquinone oxidoreductase subunit 2 (subunit N)